MSDAILAPGEMRCAKCGFTLIRKTLFVQSGTVGAGTSETEPCPNGCGPLWPRTWREVAIETGERLEEMFERLRKVKEVLRQHHEWRQQIGVVLLENTEHTGNNEPIEFDLSTEYADSTLCDLTVEALS